MRIEDCPIYNWQKVYGEGDLTYLVKNGDILPPDHYIEAFDTLLNDYIKHFGLSKSLRKLNRLKLRLLAKNLEFIETGKRILMNEIKIIRSEIDDITNAMGVGADFHQQHILIEKWYRQPIDLKKTSVLKYKNIVKSYEQENKQRQSSRGGRIR